MRTRNHDDWTIDRWRTEPRLRAFDIEMFETEAQNPPLWKDVTLASIIAALLGVAAAGLV